MAPALRLPIHLLITIEGNRGFREFDLRKKYRS
jgi:hypothetical protein